MTDTRKLVLKTPDADRILSWRSVRGGVEIRWVTREEQLDEGWLTVAVNVASDSDLATIEQFFRWHPSHVPTAKVRGVPDDGLVRPGCAITFEFLAAMVALDSSDTTETWITVGPTRPVIEVVPA